ncbi:MAG: putative peptidoglycan glycosyltransferase FtsW [Chloroflexota bacterium]
MGSGTFVKKLPRQQTGKSQQINLAGIDLVLFSAMFPLAGFGLLMVYSASTDYSVVVMNQLPNYLFIRQVIWFVLGSFIAALLAMMDYHHFQKFAVPLILISIGSLIAVLVGGEELNGAVRTFFGGSIQPSEFAKIATIIYLSVWLYRKKDSLHVFSLGLIPLSVIMGVISGLILLQPDLSATFTIIIMGSLLFFLADGDLKQILVIGLIAAVCGSIVLKVSTTGQDRILPYLDFLRDPTQAIPQLRQSLGAIVNGKFFGVGLGKSNAKFTGLSLPHSDSIFSVLVEETGLLGAICLIGLYGVILWRGLRISKNAPDLLGSLLAAGLTFWIIIEAAINMGAMVGIFPFAGVALPFISHGGSSLVTVLAGIGIILNISRQSGQTAQDSERRSYSASVDLRRRDGRRRVSRPRHTASNDR